MERFKNQLSLLNKRLSTIKPLGFLNGIKTSQEWEARYHGYSEMYEDYDLYKIQASKKSKTFKSISPKL